MMTIDKFNFAGKKAIVRVDFNVPLDHVAHGQAQRQSKRQIFVEPDC